MSLCAPQVRLLDAPEPGALDASTGEYGLQWTILADQDTVAHGPDTGAGSSFRTEPFASDDLGSSGREMRSSGALGEIAFAATGAAIQALGRSPATEPLLRKLCLEVGGCPEGSCRAVFPALAPSTPRSPAWHQF